MAKGSNIVHRYFKKEFEEFTILVKVDPYRFTGTEITLNKDGTSGVRTILVRMGFPNLAHSNSTSIIQASHSARSATCHSQR
jgi:hypothetical protein